MKPGKAGRGNDRFDVREIFGGEDAILEFRRDTHTAYFRVSERGTDESNILESGQLEIADILAAAAQKAVVFLSQ